MGVSERVKKPCLICLDSGYVEVLDQPGNKKTGAAAVYKKQRCPRTCPIPKEGGVPR